MPYGLLNSTTCRNKKESDTHKRSSPNGIRRRRECLKCGKRYTTYEKTARDDLWIIKKDGSRERFDIEKLKKGVEKAFEKRPVSHEKINKMMNEVEEMLRRKGKKEIRSTVLGELVIKKIRKLDDIAYIRFASVYKNFQNINDFKEAIKEL
ncbi:transcriptional regulator NrdR [Candidatus Pacearchaeota archaeon]|nr:transcriptional regulator NrdR [Candidatus Pacearchaeota archaeon]